MRSPRASGLSLATFATTVAQRRAAYGAAALIAAVVLGSLPFASLRGKPVPAFMAINVTMIAIIDFVTAFLLFRQGIAGALRPIAILGAAYLFTGTIVIAYLMAFPDSAGTFSFGAGPQSAIWIWVAWKIGFIALILSAVRDEYRDPRRLLSRADLQQLFSWLPALIVGSVFLMAWYAIAHGDRLPPLIVERAYTPLFLQVLCPLIALGCAVCAGLLLARSRGSNVAHLWLTITCVAVAAEVLMTGLGATRYSVGFYAARVESLVAASVVLFALLQQSGRLADAIAAAERQARAIVENVADALLTVDASGRITDVNPAACKLFESERNAFARIDEVIVDFAFVRRSQRGASSFEAVGRTTSGRSFPLEVTVGGAGDPIDTTEGPSTIIIARDITARKRAESAIAVARDQAIETSRLKAQFLATMSHEIRTPINGVIGMTELLLGTELAGERRSFAETVRDSAESLLEVINNILDFSKIEAGKFELESIAFSPGDTLEASAEILAPNAQAKGIGLLTFVDPSVPSAVIGDSNRLRQVLLNLVGNAIKFTEAGNVTLRLTRDSAPRRLRFSVSDSGIGISTTMRDALFEPFRQGDGSAKRRYGGSGLGLSISQKLIAMMGGSIEVDSTLGSGSHFWFTVPVEILDGVSSDRPALPDGFAALVVDSNDTASAIVRAYIESWGGRVQTVASVQSAARVAQAFDVVLVDSAVGDFYALQGAAPRIVLCADSETGRAALERGFASFVRKPLRRAPLFDAVALALTGAKQAPVLGDHAGPQDRHPGTVILLAEDHPVNQKLALRQLEKLGYVAHAVANGREAVEAVATGAYTLVLMDCQMPVLDGFGAARSIRTNERATGAHIPIVAMTANAFDSDRDACLAAGMDGYLSKPVQMSALAAEIERFTEAVRAQ